MAPEPEQETQSPDRNEHPSLPESPVESAVRRAVRLTAPGASAAVVAALFATGGASVWWFALGVALGALAGAVVSALLAAQRKIEEARPQAPLNRREQISEEALAAAAALAGPAVNLGEAVADTLRVLERLPVALLLLDEKGRITFSNSSADAYFGRAALGQHFSSALRAPALVEAIREAYAGRRDGEVDFQQRRFQEKSVRATIRSLSGEAAEGLESPMLGHARVAVLLQDHTKIRRAEQLHRDFVANASHELKTPIAVIAGFIETLRGAAKNDVDAQDRFLRIMEQQAERMRRLVEDLLSLNRIELNEHVPPRERLDLPALVQRAAKQSPEYENGRIELHFADCHGATQIIGDAGQLEQVFINLIENALKYGGDERPIEVRLQERSEPRRQFGIEVRDFGPGIAKEKIPRLTERFYRVEAQKGALKSGTGLGLSIVKHAVSRHRGDLEVDSQLGQGSSFTVWLPPAEDFELAPSEA